MTLGNAAGAKMIHSAKTDKTSKTVDNSKFGTFKGVFTPSILTILGVIMYLRFGWVVGNGGLIGAVLVVLLAHAISYTTGLSVSAIATNRTIKTGGDYYMISRSLGLPIGGAIGLALFFALALSTSLYIIGFTESFVDAFHIENTPFNRRLIGSITCVTITVITFISTSLALKIQYLVLAAIALSLVSLFLGESSTAPTTGPQLWFSADSESFETLFAVFFPAVTGFTAGVAMSGDLKDPRRAIPRGTMAAITVGMLVYLAIPVFLSYKVDSELLRTDQMVWLQIARVPELVIAGVFAATLSSALGSILGAPRYLQALAMDGVVPRFLGKGYGVLNEPRVGTLVTFMVAQAGIVAGELDLIARIITMFFLTSYGFICLASGVQAWSGIASYRPDFKTPAWVSFIGAAVCLGIMFKLDTVAMVCATTAMFGIYALLQRRRFRASPKDTWGGFWSAVVQKGLLHLHKRVGDSKNWRPNAVVFAGDPTERQHLIHFARWLVQGRGLATYFYLIRGDILLESRRASHLEPTVRETVGRIFPEMLSQVAVTKDIYEGIINASQSYGLSGMKPNTVIMGWGEESTHPEEFTHLVRSLLALDHNLLFIEQDEGRSFGKHETIDIWWRGLDRNGELMLLIAYLLKSSATWSRAKVRINVLVDSAETQNTAESSLRRVIDDSRVRAEPNVILRTDREKSIADHMVEISGNTDLVILGLREPLEDEKAHFVSHVTSFIDRLGTVLLVRASSQFEGASLLFDEE
jgi:solute carrier family 12 (sodium/potassium/chloride transporter), member 2